VPRLEHPALLRAQLLADTHYDFVGHLLLKNFARDKLAASFEHSRGATAMHFDPPRNTSKRKKITPTCALSSAARGGGWRWPWRPSACPTPAAAEPFPLRTRTALRRCSPRPRRAISAARRPCEQQAWQPSPVRVVLRRFTLERGFSPDNPRSFHLRQRSQLACRHVSTSEIRKILFLTRKTNSGAHRPGTECDCT